MINMNFIVLFSLPMRSPRRRRSSVSRSCRADLDMLVVRDLRRILGSVEVRSHALGALTPETIAAQLATNLVTPILLAQAALPRAGAADLRLGDRAASGRRPGQGHQRTS
ncbi:MULTISPECIES: hypothetical protein [unclassified Streptomyces]|uniref:hypothetical protein n=1 Tax=unclassified Streptomyces TaxID=2593676 RepID=UPI0037F37159